MNKLEGIILSIQEYREYDLLVHVLCKDDQKHTFVAKGAQKINSKLSGFLQPFVHAYFYANMNEKKNIHTLRTVDMIASNYIIHQDLLKNACGTIICELVFAMTEELECFEMLKQGLSFLLKTQYPLCLTSIFLAKINQKIGIQAFVDGCVNCHSLQHINSISLAQGGFLCYSCSMLFPSILCNKEELKCIRYASKVNINDFEKVERMEGFTYKVVEVFYNFIYEYQGIYLHSMKFLKEVSALYDLSKHNV